MISKLFISKFTVLFRLACNFLFWDEGKIQNTIL
jgi:hypothetical protein